MDVSENSGTPKSSILIRFSIINHPFWGTPIFGNIHIYIYINIPFHIQQVQVVRETHESRNGLVLIHWCCPISILFCPDMVLQNEFSSCFIIFGCFLSNKQHQNWQSCWLSNYFNYYPQKIITSFFLFPNHAWRLQVLFIHFTQIFREPTAVSYGWTYPTLSRIRTWRRWSKHLLLGWT